MGIPVYSVKVPEYKIKKFRKAGKKVEYAITPWFGIRVPKVYADNKPDFAEIGAKIDPVLKKHFMGQKVAVRCLSSKEHPGKTVSGLVATIKKLGTDRYDPNRKGEKYENVENKHIDFFALGFEIKQDERYMEKFIEPFYYAPLEKGSEPRKIDIIIVYDIAKISRVLHRYEGRSDIKDDGFVFKDPENKPVSVLGIIKVL